MSARLVSWAVPGVAAVITAAAAVISLIGGDRLEVERDVFIWAITLVFLVAGHVIATRQPRNPIGWIFLGGGVSAALARLSGAYGDYWLDTGEGPRALGQTAAAYGEISWVPFVLVPATFLLLLFPDGRLLSSRWRPVAWCAVVGIVGVVVTTVLKPGTLEDHPDFPNPYGVESSLLTALEGPAYLALMVGLLGSAASLVLRFRRARGEQRQQMKWIALAGALAAIVIPMMFVFYEYLGQGFADGAIMLSILGLPAATAVAIMRYRLYDIDVVINRTLVYGSLTATLAGVYVGSVLLLQLVLSDLTQGSGLAVAASTLAVAALFRPVRTRIQQIVDRRFFRSRYDAAQTIELFGARLRDEVDLAALSADLQSRGEGDDAARARLAVAARRRSRRHERARRAGVGDGDGDVRRHPRLHDVRRPLDGPRGDRLPQRVLRGHRPRRAGARRPRQQAARRRPARRLRRTGPAARPRRPGPRGRAGPCSRPSTRGWGTAAGSGSVSTPGSCWSAPSGAAATPSWG